MFAFLQFYVLITLSPEKGSDAQGNRYLVAESCLFLLHPSLQLLPKRRWPFIFLKGKAEI